MKQREKPIFPSNVFPWEPTCTTMINKTDSKKLGIWEKTSKAEVFLIIPGKLRVWEMGKFFAKIRVI